MTVVLNIAAGRSLGKVGRACILVSVCLLSSIVFLQTSSHAEEQKADPDGQWPLELNSPGSIVKRLETDTKKKEFLFDTPGLTAAMKPWYDFKAEMAKKHGFNFGLSFTTLYQKASDGFGPEDDAAGFDLDLSGSWTFRGRGTGSPTVLGFNFFWRDMLGTNIAPQTLFTQYGGLYSSAAPYGVNDPVVGELWIQQKFDNAFGFRVGKIFPITAYDFFPFKNFRTDFVDFNQVTNATIPLPGNGFGGFVVYRPQPNILLRAGVHDANADVEKSGFDTYDGELFSIFEIGVDTGLVPRTPGRPPNGHVHLSVWHQDEREDAGVDDGWGFGISGLQRFGKYSPYLRYGYADNEVGGPSSVEHMINAGLVIDEIFGHANDRIGLGLTWSDPIDRSLDEQIAIDAYYRVQLTQELQFGPVVELIFDPVRNPDEDTIVVWGLRTRLAL